MPHRSTCQSCGGQFCGYHLAWWEYSGQITCVNCVMHFEYVETQLRWLHNGSVNACSECGVDTETQICMICQYPTCAQCGLYIKDTGTYAHASCYNRMT